MIQAKIVELKFKTFPVLVCHSKNKEKNKARLTFSNPNYNGSNYNDEPHKSTFFKKFKYDKAQVNVTSIFNYDKPNKSFY